MEILVNKERSERPHDTPTTVCSPDITKLVNKFHSSFPNYSPTPLVELKGLAAKLNLKKLWIKDESYRFGLNAFKSLGASWAIANVISDVAGVPKDQLTFDLLVSPEIREKFSNTTFVTATDGNHGRAVAWVAQQLHCKAVVYMPAGSTASRVEAIAGHGADVTVIEGNYDDAVGLAAQNAAKYGWVVIQDTAWEGYTDIPAKVMQGYSNILTEALAQLNGEVPTHVFIQCGVGSLASSLQATLNCLYGENRPIYVVVEPTKADCLFKSFKTGTPQTVTGSMDTIMNGLACGIPSSLGWPILRDYADAFVSCEDHVTEVAMYTLFHPLGDDKKVVSGESGAVCLGVVIQADAAQRQLLKLDENSKVLCVSTEGNTDPEMHNKITTDPKNKVF